MTTPILPPEPPDGTAYYWPELTPGSFAHLAIRDDKAAAAAYVAPGERWFEPNTVHAPVSWARLLDQLGFYRLAEAVVLRAAGEWSHGSRADEEPLPVPPGVDGFRVGRQP